MKMHLQKDYSFYLSKKVMIPARPFTTLRYIDDGKPSRVCDDCKAALEVQEAEEAAAARDQLYKNRSSRKIVSRRLFSRE